ncbi:uncharacterized protein LOC127419023 [Myxocyprinus asiaticus]|uniref:uncharacterized protein LOC127419023 n=1 Tax=Myxocyprinus asiaticus TaxID=70543 RepID=UPI002223C0C6|nr:uncharacterized protein LOC127419023 [Myxocyprinus asiaticus]
MTSTACCPAPCHKGNALTWLLCPGIDHVSTALQTLNELAQERKGELVEKVLQQCNPEACIYALQKLLNSSASWLRSTAACIFAVLLENESMVLKLQKWTEGDNGLICSFVEILTKDEPDSVMNATGAIASLVDTFSGRQWLLQSQNVFSQVLESLSILLTNERENTVNSAALILARLSLCEEACQKILSHPSASRTFRHLVKCLSCGHKDTAMNAAFAVGLLCESGQNKSLILREAKDHELVSRLQALISTRSGVEMGQTACFGMSCLANDEDGHALLMESTSCTAVLDGLLQLLRSTDPDTVWFAAMTIRVLVSRPRGVVLIRTHCPLQAQLKLLSMSSSTGPELQEEVSMCLRRLERLPKPASVTVTNLSSTVCTVSWDRCEPESGLEVIYSLFDRDVMLYRGPMCQATLPVSTNQSKNSLSLRLHLSTPDGDISPFSEAVDVTLEQLDAKIRPPRELCVIGCTATQVHLRWLEPEGEVKPKSYRIYCNDTLVKTTTLQGAVVSGLSPSTSYQLSVSSLGPGDTQSPRAGSEVRTADDQDHAPSSLTIAVLGRHEIQINWRAPVVPLGRLFKYELSLNGCVVYLGTERAYTARRLSANTAYTCIITAITSRGRCQSRPVTKKTARDEYMHSNRYLHSPTHQTYSKTPTPSPSSQERSEVRKKATNSPAILGHKPTVHSSTGQHRAFDLRKHMHRRSSIQIHIPKLNKSSNRTSKDPVGIGTGCDFNVLLKTDKESPAVVFPVSSNDHLMVSHREQSESTHRSQTQSSTPGDLTHPKVMITQARRLQWSSGRKVPTDREKLPCISKQNSEDVRLLQPVSFSWSNLEWTRQHQNKGQRDKNNTILKVQSQQKRRHDPSHTKLT